MSWPFLCFPCAAKGVSQGIQSKILTSEGRDTKSCFPLKSSIVSLGTLSRKDKGHKAQQRVCRPPSLKRKKDHGQQDFFNYCCFPFAALFEKKKYSEWLQSSASFLLLASLMLLSVAPDTRYSCGVKGQKSMSKEAKNDKCMGTFAPTNKNYIEKKVRQRVTIMVTFTPCLTVSFQTRDTRLSWPFPCFPC